MKTASVSRATTMRRAAASILLAGGALGLMAGPASASVVDTDSVRIAVPGGNADFGSGLHVGFPGTEDGAPLGSGTLTWDVTGTTTTARLKGQVYWDNTHGGCARVRMTLYKNAQDPGTSKYSGNVRRNGDKGIFEQAPSLPVDLKIDGLEGAYKVLVTTQEAEYNCASFSNVGKARVYLGPPD